MRLAPAAHAQKIILDTGEDDKTIAEDSQDQGGRGNKKTLRPNDRKVLPAPKRTFTAGEFRSVTRPHFIMGIVSLWREIERMIQFEETIRMHARAVLRLMAEFDYRNCGGPALSPQHGEVLRYCSLIPIGIRPSGSLGATETP